MNNTVTTFCTVSRVLMVVASLLILPAAHGSSAGSNDVPKGLNLLGLYSDGTVVLDRSGSSLNQINGPGLATESGGSGAATLVAIGPVTSLDSNRASSVVAGQTVFFTKSTQFIGIERASIPTGSYVAVAGDVIGPGELIARLVVTMPTQYAAGSTPVYIRGVLQNVDHERNSAVVGATRVNYAQLTGTVPELSDGSLVEIVGYADSNEVTAAEVADASGAATISINATQGIHGSELKGIHGSGVKGIHGSGLKGIHGSGVKGIHGSGLKGIHGSGAR